MKSADPQEIKSIIQGLASRDEGERNSVAWKLQRAADATDELVVAELVRHLCDEHPPVRRSAQRTLREVVPQSCDVVLPLLLSRTGTANAGGRMEVLKALEHFAERGDARVTKAMLARLADAEASVRAQALSSLAVCAEEDDDRVLTQVLERLEDVDEHVRGAVAKALPSVASRGNHQVMRCLARLCRNEKPPPQRETLKEAACRALATFAPGDAEAISLVGECIHEDYPQASIAALKALLLLVPSGDHHGLDTVAGALRHPDLQLREMATHVLERLAASPHAAGHIAGPTSSCFEGVWSGGTIRGSKIFWNCDDLITDVQLKGPSILSTLCVDKQGRQMNCWARLVHPELLRWDFGEEWLREDVAEKDSTAGLPTLSLAAMQTEEASGYPPEAAESAPVPLEEADAYAVAAVAVQFKCEDPLVRKSAVQAIPRVAGKGCGTAIHALLPMMQDESVDVRLAAVRSLWQVAPAGHGEAIEALRVRLEDQEISKDCPRGQSVGISAARALKKMVTCREELQKIAEHLNFQGPTLRGF